MGHWIIRQTVPASQRRTPRPPQAQTEAGMEMGKMRDIVIALHKAAEETGAKIRRFIAVVDEEQGRRSRKEAEMDTDEARVRRYADAVQSGNENVHGYVPCWDEADSIARAVIAVADEEQTELRAEVERLRAGRDFVQRTLAETLDRAETAEKRLAAMEALAREAAGAIVSGHGHWDSTMQYGAGCHICLSQRDERDRLVREIDTALVVSPDAPEA